MAIVKLSATERRRLSAFITCLVIAIVAWLFTTLSNNYNYAVQEVLTFKNAPQKRAYHSLQPDTVTAIVQGSGWEMVFSKMNADTKPVTVDLSSLENRNFVVLNSQIKQINERKESPHQIISIDPDTLYFDFSNRLTKRVPVQAIMGLKYQKQFALSGDVTIKPAYVTISGPTDRLQKLSSWKTDSILEDHVNETINKRINLQPVKEGNLNVYPKVVQVIIPVDEFTEKTLEIPVKLTNNHNYYTVKVFPQKVKVTFTTSLNRYRDMNEELFEATVDLDLWKDHGYSSLPVKLSHFPPYCKIVKISPSNIDFIVKK